MKGNKKNYKNIILIIVAILIISTLFIVNIIYACKPDANSNLLTAISGWVGFIATAIVGIITLYQNKVYSKRALEQNRLFDERQQRQYEIEQLKQFKNSLKQDYNKFNEKLSGLKMDFIRAKATCGEKIQIIESVSILEDIINYISNQIFVLECSRYQFDDIVQLIKKLKELKNIIIDIKIKNADLTLNDKYFEKFNETRKQFFLLIVGIDDCINDLQDVDMEYNEFMDKISLIKDVDNQIKEIAKIEGLSETDIEEMFKENEDGQTKNANK